MENAIANVNKIAAKCREDILVRRAEERAESIRKKKARDDAAEPIIAWLAEAAVKKLHDVVTTDGDITNAEFVVNVYAKGVKDLKTRHWKKLDKAWLSANLLVYEAGEHNNDNSPWLLDYENQTVEQVDENFLCYDGCKEGEHDGDDLMHVRGMTIWL